MPTCVEVREIMAIKKRNNPVAHAATIDGEDKMADQEVRRFVQEEVAWALHEEDETLLEQLIENHFCSTAKEHWLWPAERALVVQTWKTITDDHGVNKNLLDS